MSVAQLEEFLSFMVMKSSPNNSECNNVSKPCWWPRELAFHYPVVRANTVNALKWREILEDLITRCYSFHKTQRFARLSKRVKYSELSDKRQNYQHDTSEREMDRNKLKRLRSQSDSKNEEIHPEEDINKRHKYEETATNKRQKYEKAIKKKQKYVGMLAKQRKSSPERCDKMEGIERVNLPIVLIEKITDKRRMTECDKETQLHQSDNEETGNRMELFKQISENNELDRKSLNDITKFLPIIKLSDVLKVKPTEPKLKPVIVTQDSFLSYFGLENRDEVNLDKTVDIYKPTNGHPTTLVNTPQVPFSSEYGIKLTKNWHKIPLETHERRIERTERFLSTNSIISKSSDIQYEVTYNKSNDNFNHFYLFPSTKFRRKNRLTLKARCLFALYCKPCTVSLIKLENTTTENFKEKSSEKNIEKNILKENIDFITGLPFNYPNIKTNCKTFHDLTTKENSPVKNPNFNFSQSFSPNNAVPKTFNFSSNNAVPKTFSQLPLVMKTLTPRNENSIENSENSVEKSTQSTMVVEKSTRSLTRYENLINASLILTPINDFFGHRSDNDETTNENKKTKKKNGIKKKRVLIDFPRRISPRLHIGNENHVTFV